MSEAGYTATEALAALAILGLAVGGLTGGLKVIGVGQLATGRKVAEADTVRTVSAELAGLVRGRGPFRSDVGEAFAGDERGFSFPCGAGQCVAQLTDTGLRLSQPNQAPRVVALSRPAELRFRYQGSWSQAAAWPPATPLPPAPQWQVLRTILLAHQGSDEAVTAVHIAEEQPADCEYDGILQDCRKTGS